MDKDHDLKEMIISKLKNFIKLNLESKKNDKYLLKDLNEIKMKPISQGMTIFFHQMYKNVKIDFN